MNLRPSGYEPDVERSSAPAGIPVSASPGQQRQPPHDTRSDSFPNQETKIEPEEEFVWLTHLERAEQYRLLHPDHDGRKPAQPSLGSGFRPHGVFLTGADVAFHWTSGARQALLGPDNGMARLLPWGARPDRPTGGARGGGSAAIPWRTTPKGAIMPKFTDSQLVILSAAARREDARSCPCLGRSPAGPGRCLGRVASTGGLRSPASRFWRPARISLTPPQRALGARPASCDRPRPSSPRTDGRPRRDRGRLTGAVRPADINSAPP